MIIGLVSSALYTSSRDPLTDYLANSPIGYASAHSNYVRSCAAYAVLTYVLGVGDRHLDNIMMKDTGVYIYVCALQYIMLMFIIVVIMMIR